jgi:Mrp family chromosome partitioning ATPase
VHHSGHGRLGQPLQLEGLKITLVPGERSPAAGATYRVKVYSLDDVFVATDNALEVATPVTKVPIPGDAVKVADLTFTAKSPRLGVTFLNLLMHGYLEQRHSWETENATAAEAFVTSQLTTMRDALDDVQKKLAEYRTTHSVVVLDDQAKALVEELGKFEEQRFDSRMEVQTLTALDAALKRPNAPLEAYMFGETKDQVLTGLALSLSQARQRLAGAESRFNSVAPDVHQEREEVASQRAAIQSYVKNRLAREQESLSKLDETIGQYDDRLRTVPTAELGLAQIARESEVYSSVYSFLLKRQQETAILKASTISKNRVLDDAEVPYLETWPKVWLPLVGIAVGLALGTIVVLLRGHVSGRLQTELDVRRWLGRAPVFATIPRVSVPKPVSSADHTSESELASSYWEAFRTLRTNLLHASGGHDGPVGQVVLITSPGKGDGKTTCSYSFASMLARSGSSVLVVDTDLRDKAQGAASGNLRAVLEGRETWESMVEQVTVAPGCQFDVIHGGGPASSELLSMNRMRELISEARWTYGYVVLDSTSFPAFSDALLLLPLADCILSIVRLEHTHRRLAVENARRLSECGALYGVVLNGARA